MEFLLIFQLKEDIEFHRHKLHNDEMNQQIYFWLRSIYICKDEDLLSGENCNLLHRLNVFTWRNALKL